MQGRDDAEIPGTAPGDGSDRAKETGMLGGGRQGHNRGEGEGAGGCGRCVLGGYYGTRPGGLCSGV